MTEGEAPGSGGAKGGGGGGRHAAIKQTSHLNSSESFTSTRQ